MHGTTCETQDKPNSFGRGLHCSVSPLRKFKEKNEGRYLPIIISSLCVSLLKLVNLKCTAVFWVVAPYILGANCLHQITLMMEAVSTSETSVNYQTTRWYNPEDSNLHSRRRENLKSHLWTRRPLFTKSGMNVVLPEATNLITYIFISCDQ
jgi:hypothetical protein